MLKQYQEIKSKHRDCILFFRLGDFYEMFADDARKASPILDVVLTSRDAGKSGRIPMCGIPYHAADSYISRLIKAGLKVAICEQVEDPALAKGLVKRDVIRVITSGIYIDDASFEARRLACVSFHDNRFGLAFTDTASGMISANEYPEADRLAEALAKISPYECVFPEQFKEKVDELFKNPLLRSRPLTFSPFEDWAFNVDICAKTLNEHFHTHSLSGFGLEDMPAAVAASGALLEYMRRMHHSPLLHIDRLSLYTDSEHVFISPAACAGLELDGLMTAIDRTLTSMGRRRLKDWIYHPLKSAADILHRQEAVTLLRGEEKTSEALALLLRGTADIEKSLSRISCGSGTARDLLALRTVLARRPDIAALLGELARRKDLFHLEDPARLRLLLERAVSPDIPLSHPEGRVINAGYNPELDGLRDIQENARQWLKDLQAREIKRSAINSLKVGFNQVFGYYIEISKANLEKVPQDYIRRQTLANAERFVTPELKDFEEKILTAEEKVLGLERRLIEELTRAILEDSAALHAYADGLSRLDALYSLCSLSREKGYIAPGVNEGKSLVIAEGRHPVVEQCLAGAFIPNDIRLDCEQNYLVVLTGPNMSGKSTYIRQTALLVIMTQMGSYIPASSASIGMVDKIFTRIGARDDISRNMSTFMVEMSETAGILNNLSERSLIIFDEVGRGTSTFDGLSLAWAIAEYCARNKVRTLFATHFHELTALAEEFPGVKNYNVAVKEWKDEVIFLHTIIPGGTDDSYGIYVAKLAGIPKEVVQRSQQILSRLETSGSLQEKIRKIKPADNQLSLFGREPAPAHPIKPGAENGLLKKIKQELEKLDTDKLTPLEALNRLQRLKEQVKNEQD